MTGEPILVVDASGPRYPSVLSGWSSAPSPPPAPQPDIDQALNFLRWLHGAQQTYSVVAIKPDHAQGEEHIECRTTRDLEQVREFIVRNSARGWNLYMQGNGVRRDLGGARASKSDVVAAMVVHVDVDPPDTITTPKALAAWQVNYAPNWPELGLPPPTVIVASGSGYQCLWRLTTPLALFAGEKGNRYQHPLLVDSVEGVNKQLAKLLDGDSVAATISNLLRLPGTINFAAASKRKKGRTVPVLARATWSDATYPLEAFPRTVAPAHTPSTPGTITVPQVAVEVSTENLAKVIELVGSRWPARGGRSCHFALANILIRAGWEDRDIAELLYAIAMREDAQNPATFDARVRIVEWCRAGEGGNQYGYPYLIEQIGQETVDEMVRLLDLRGHVNVDELVASLTPCSHVLPGMCGCSEQQITAGKAERKRVEYAARMDREEADEWWNAWCGLWTGISDHLINCWWDAWQATWTQIGEHRKRRPTDNAIRGALRAAARRRGEEFKVDVECLKQVLASGPCIKVTDEELKEIIVALWRHCPPGTCADQVCSLLRNRLGGGQPRLMEQVLTGWAPPVPPPAPKTSVTETVSDGGLAGYAAIASNYIAQYRTHDDVPTLRRWQDHFYVWQPDKGCYVEFASDALHRDLYQLMKLDEDKHVNKTVNALVGVPSVLIEDNQTDRWLDGQQTSPLSTVVAKNGILDLESGELRPSSPNFFTLATMGVEYDPGALTPERWLKFLGEIFPDEQIDPTDDAKGYYRGAEKIDCLQEIMGYLLTPDTRQDRIFLFEGLPRSGKGTILRVITRLLGHESDGYVSSTSLRDLGSAFGKEGLIGKRVVVIGDAKLGSKSDTSQILSELLGISGRDLQSINRKNEKFWRGYLSTRFVLGCNGAPVFADPSGALAARLLLLRFRQSFVGRENRGLTEELYDELPGILNWCIEGWRRLHERGRLIQPKDGEQDLKDLQDQGSHVVAWIRECCIVGKDERVLAVNARASYDYWCATTGIPERERFNAITLGRELAEAGYPVKRFGKDNASHYLGLRMRTGKDGPAG